MKVLCPRCKQRIDLHYLEKKGDQMAHCAKCNTIVAATFKEDRDRLYWEVYFEQPLRPPKKKPEGGGCGCATAIVVAILVLAALAIGYRNFHNDRPAEAPAERF